MDKPNGRCSGRIESVIVNEVNSYEALNRKGFFNRNEIIYMSCTLTLFVLSAIVVLGLVMIQLNTNGGALCNMKNLFNYIGLAVTGGVALGSVCLFITATANFRRRVLHSLEKKDVFEFIEKTKKSTKNQIVVIGKHKGYYKAENKKVACLQGFLKSYNSFKMERELLTMLVSAVIILLSVSIAVLFADKLGLNFKFINSMRVVNVCAVGIVVLKIILANLLVRFYSSKKNMLSNYKKFEDLEIHKEIAHMKNNLRKAFQAL